MVKKTESSVVTFGLLSMTSGHLKLLFFPENYWKKQILTSSTNYRDKVSLCYCDSHVTIIFELFSFLSEFCPLCGMVSCLL